MSWRLMSLWLFALACVPKEIVNLKWNGVIGVLDGKPT